MQSKGALIGLIAITAVGAAARFATLDSQSLWLDEAFTVNQVLHPSLGDTLAAIPDTGYTPHLYFVVTWLWSQPFGLGEYALRSVSAIAGTATIVVAYTIGRELRSDACGLLLAALVAVQGALFWYSQELRSYALYTLLVALSLLFFLRARRTESTRDLAAWAVVSAIAIATHYYAGYFVAVEGAWLLLASANHRRILIAFIPVVATALAYTPLVIHQARMQHQFSAFGPLGPRIGQLGETLFDPGYPALAVAAGAAAALAVVLAARFGSTADRDSLLVCGALAAAVIGIPITLALVSEDFFLARNVLPVTLVLLTAIAVAVSSLPTHLRVPLTVVIVGLLSVSTVSQVLGHDPQRPDWRTAIDRVRQEGGVQIVIGGEGTWDPFHVYLPQGTAAQGSPWGARYRTRRLVLVGQCGRDLQGMLAASGSDCQWSRGRPPWVPVDFRQSGEQRTGNVMLRTMEAPRPTPVDVTLPASRIGYSAFVLPDAATQGLVLVVKPQQR